MRLSQFELWWRYPAQVALFFFGLVNAGVPLHALEAGTWGVPIAVIAGKPSGILIATAAALAAGLHLPRQVGWRELIVVGFAAAIGFSIGLFFCTALFPPGQLRSETRMGVLLSLAGAPFASCVRKTAARRQIRTIAGPRRRDDLHGFQQFAQFVLFVLGQRGLQHPAFAGKGLESFENLVGG